MPAALRSPRPLPAPVTTAIALTARRGRARRSKAPQRHAHRRVAGRAGAGADADRATRCRAAGLAHCGAHRVVARLDRTARRNGRVIAAHRGRRARRCTPSSKRPWTRSPARDGFAPFLLDGVTGSGKTEVYLAPIAACARARRAGAGAGARDRADAAGSCARFARRSRRRDRGAAFGPRRSRTRARTGCAHRARRRERRARHALGDLRAAAAAGHRHRRRGARRARTSSRTAFATHARDLAVLRAQALDVPVVLGSATPSLETLAQRRRRALSLAAPAASRRRRREPPALRVVDLRKQSLQHGLAPSHARRDRGLRRARRAGADLQEPPRLRAGAACATTAAGARNARTAIAR